MKQPTIASLSKEVRELKIRVTELETQCETLKTTWLEVRDDFLKLHELIKGSLPGASEQESWRTAEPEEDNTPQEKPFNEMEEIDKALDILNEMRKRRQDSEELPKDNGDSSEK